MLYFVMLSEVSVRSCVGCSGLPYLLVSPNDFPLNTSCLYNLIPFYIVWIALYTLKKIYQPLCLPPNFQHALLKDLSPCYLQNIVFLPIPREGAIYFLFIWRIVNLFDIFYWSLFISIHSQCLRIYFLVDIIQDSLYNKSHVWLD